MLNEMKMILSLIIPIYNVEVELRELLSGLRQVSLQNVELVFVDDGSSDSSGSVVDNFSQMYDGNIKVIHQENQGLSGARNTGIHNARGKYLWFVDPDDLIEVQLISHVVNFLQKNPAIEFVQFQYDTFETVDELACGNKNSTNKRFTAESIGTSEMFNLLATGKIQNFAWAHVIQKKIFTESNVSFPKGVTFEDVATTYKLILSSKVLALSSNVLYHYRIRKGSIMRTPSIKSVADLAKVAVGVRDNFPSLKSDAMQSDFVDRTFQIAINRSFEVERGSAPESIRSFLETEYCRTKFSKSGRKGLQILLKKILMRVRVYDILQSSRVKRMTEVKQ